MKKIKWYQWILITIVILFLIMATLIIFVPVSEHPCPKCKPITKEVIKEVPVNQEEIDKLKEKNKILKQILDVDNKGFLKTSELIEIFTLSIPYIYNHNIYEIQEHTKKIDTITKEINIITQQKVQLSLKFDALE